MPGGAIFESWVRSEGQGAGSAATSSEYLWIGRNKLRIFLDRPQQAQNISGSAATSSD